jgi:hypothetical protein
MTDQTSHTTNEDQTPITPAELENVYRFLVVYNRASFWERKRMMFLLAWAVFKCRIPDSLRKFGAALLTNHGTAIVLAVLALLLVAYTLIGVYVNYSPELVQFSALVGMLIGAALGKAFA